MAWLYDVTRDVLSITYGRPDDRPARSVAAGEAVLYLDQAGQAIRIEIQRASRRHNIAHVLRDGDTPARDYLDITAAAAQFGVKPFALREEILSGGMPADRFGEGWRIRRDVLEIYREILDARRVADRR